MDRKLASIQIIKDLKPIEGKDRILQATVLGWTLIVGKDDFKIGDKCIYIEPDSVLDANNPIFDQARKRSNRVKTIKLGGIYSQGIAYPLSILPENDWQEGDDVSSILHITKYDEYAGDDIEVSVSKKPKYNWFQRLWYRIFGFPQRKKGGFTTLVSKTDETRIQNIPEVLQYKEPISISEKVDGMSCTATIEGTFLGHKFNLYSRNLHLEKDGSKYWQAIEIYDLEERMELMMNELNVPWLAIQGEVAGPAIQKNPLQLKDIDFFIFNIITPNGRFGNKEMVELCYRYGLTTVPIISYDYILPDTVEEVLKYATGPSMVNPQVMREGIVCRSLDGKKSFKAVSPEYLVRHNA